MSAVVEKSVKLRIDDLAEPRLSDIQSQAVAAAEAVPIDLSVEGVLSAARERTGLHDFGAEDFRERLAIWVQATADDNELRAFGRLAIWGDMVRYAAARLQFEDFVRRNPAAAEYPVERPLMIAGLPRSGTTHLLTLFSGDDRLRTLPYWEAVRPIADPYIVNGIDQRRDLAEAEWQQRDALLPYSKSIHEFSPDHISEDVELQCMNFGSYYLEWLADAPAWRDYYFAHDQSPIYEYMKRVLGAISYQKGPDRWVSKCPQHMEQLPAIAKVFPDALTVVLHRDPVASIQSALTGVAYLNRVLRQRIDLKAFSDYWIDRYERLLRACVRDRDILSDDQSIDVYFHAFMANQPGTIQAIYAKADLPYTEAAEHGLAAVMADNQRGRYGQLTYDLRGDFGIDPADLRERFAFYFDRFPVKSEVE